MKFIKLTIYSVLGAAMFTGCCNTSCDDVWENSKTGGRHISRGIKSFGGKCGDSRAVQDPADFCGPEGFSYGGYQRNRSVGQDFVPLADQPESDEIAMADYVSKQPREIPGDPGSTIPGVDSFREAESIPGLASIFQNIHFGYNSYLIKGDDNSETIRQVSNYLKSHPRTYVFIEGHTDQRGAEAYNLSLGSRRANAVRDEILAYGVNPDNVFTISYGKERPLVMENHEEAWAKNRRSEFKIYQR